MQKKNTTSRLFNLTGFDNEYKAIVQLIGEAWRKQDDSMTNQDALRKALGIEAHRLGVTRSEIEARAAELDAADQMKAGQK